MDALAELLAGYCRQLCDRLGTYEAVAQVTGLDRRTARRHIQGGDQEVAPRPPETGR